MNNSVLKIITNVLIVLFLVIAGGLIVINNFFTVNYEIIKIDRGYLQGYRFKQNGKRNPGVVITFGGSEGSAMEEYGEKIAKQGYEVLSLYHFGQKNQKEFPVLMPIDFFSDVLKYIDKNISNNKEITVMGASQGAELGLILATIHPEIDNLILISPTEYTIGYNSYSRWTYREQQIPHLDVLNATFQLKNQYFNYNEDVKYTQRPMIESAIKNSSEARREYARIKVEKTRANILIFAGRDDMLIPSDIAAENIKKLRPQNTEIHIYDNVGHAFDMERRGEGFINGGEFENNLIAAEDRDRIIFERLKEWHK